MSYAYKETKDKWQREHREQRNKRRRELRAEKRRALMENLFCLLCGIRMAGRSYRARIYCNDCTRRFGRSINRLKCKRYYESKKIDKLIKIC